MHETTHPIRNVSLTTRPQTNKVQDSISHLTFMVPQSFHKNKDVMSIRENSTNKSQYDISVTDIGSKEKIRYDFIGSN
jgi:hypothetical protein